MSTFNRFFINNFVAMSKFIDYIRNSVGLRSVIVWSVIFLFSFIQPLWGGVGFALSSALLSFVSMLIVYYFTQVVLIPVFLQREKKVRYIVCSIFMVISMVIVCARAELFLFRYFDVKLKHDIEIPFTGIRFFTIFLSTFVVSNIIYFFNKVTEDAKQKEKLLSEKKMLEVRVLKSQINSHFLFNALNNVYSMIYFKDEHSAGYVLKLAQMMRYVMEDCEAELTPLSKELDYIRNYIDFQKMRFESDKDISFSYKIAGSMDIPVPPMIFQPLVENCFKHTPLDVNEESYIHISMEVKAKQIRFVSENSQPLLRQMPKSSDTGIGIENVKRRLYLYYDDKYKLDTFAGTDYFRVELVINL